MKGWHQKLVGCLYGDVDVVLGEKKTNQGQVSHVVLLLMMILTIVSCLVGVFVVVKGAKETSNEKESNAMVDKEPCSLPLKPSTWDKPLPPAVVNIDNTTTSIGIGTNSNDGESMNDFLTPSTTHGPPF